MSALGRRVACASVALLLAAPLFVACTGAPAPLPSASASRAVVAVDPAVQYADDRLGLMTIDEKIRSMIMGHHSGVDATGLGQYVSDNGFGGLILMGDNMPENPDALAAMAPIIAGEPGLPALLALDQEGGIVRRIPTDDALSALQLRSLAPSDTAAAFATRGKLLESAGITVNFGIVADVVADPASFIYDRSLGSTAEDAAERVAAAVSGERGHVLSTLKHFPGHGAATGDSHSSIPRTPMPIEQWRAEHAPPFEAGITAGAQLVMLGHLQFDSVDTVPATLSARWHQILRDELNFDGITITDDMNMLEDSGSPEYADQAQNAVLAVAAGNTMLLYVQEIDVAAVVAAVHAAVDDGTIPIATIDEAARKLLIARRTLSGDTGRFVHCSEECLAIID